MPFENVRKLLALVALQGHPDCVVTVTLPLVAASPTLAVAGVIEYVHEAAACETVKVWPATVAVAVRAVVPVLAAMVNVTDPDPARPVPFWIVRKLLALTAVHAQAVGVVTAIVPLVAVAGAVTLPGLIEYVHAVVATVNCSGVE